MADWTERLQRAKWRNMEFLTDSHDSSHGKRLVVTELPGADEPVVEDLGEKAESYKVQAYFVGPSYDLERNLFLQALALPGADWLTHPWLGEVWVQPMSWSVRESSDKGGYAAVSVDFVPGGQAPRVPEVDVVDTAFGQIDALADIAELDPAALTPSMGALTEFDPTGLVPDVAGITEFDLASLTPSAALQFVTRAQGALSTLRNLVAMARLPLTWARQVLGAIDSAKALVAEVLGIPGEYEAMWRRIGNAFAAVPNGGTAGASWMGAATTASTGSSSGSSSSATGSNSGRLTTTTTVVSLTEAERVRAVATLARCAVQTAQEPKIEAFTWEAKQLRDAATVDTAMRTAVLAAAAMTVALADYKSEAGRDDAVRHALVAVDALLPLLGDQAFTVAASARAALLLAVQAQALAPTVARDVVRPLPATVLAYAMEVGEAEFLERNGVRHPLFVQGRVYG